MGGLFQALRAAKVALCLSIALGLAVSLSSCAWLTALVGERPGIQGWTRAEQLSWYHANQGSRLIPEAWLFALEDAKSAAPFFTITRMESLGYIRPDKDDAAPYPIGFSVDRSDDSHFVRSRLRWKAGQTSTEPWTGMSCAACHTSEIRTGDGDPIRVDGGPSMGDFQSFIEQLDAAAERTLAEPAKFERFAAAVLKARAQQDAGMLRQALTQFILWERRIEALNNPDAPDAAAMRYGHGRLDAFGHIFNKVAALTEAQGQFRAPSDAPVSYPFLWNIQQHDRVQWNGIAPNMGLKLPSGETFDLGALGRNTGEVIGVFADVVVPPHYPGLKGYVSSVNVKNLDAIEAQLGRLLPPPWPSSLGAVDKNEFSRGERLYAAHCAECHSVLKREDRSTPIKAVMTPIWGDKAVGTDPWMACNAFSYRARTGRLQGYPIGYIGSGPKFGMVADDHELLSATVVGSLAEQKRKIAAAFARALFGLPRPISPGAITEPEFEQKPRDERLAICRENSKNILMAYKGRPLNGIWATAPYLHNGSVRSLYQLLLPPSRRESSFPVGGSGFDAREVGLPKTTSDAKSIFSVVDEKGAAIAGNSNLGHDYGNGGFTDADRLALIAYMKAL